MIPLRDTTKSGTFPIVNTAFIAINIAVLYLSGFSFSFSVELVQPAGQLMQGVLPSGLISEVLLQA